MNLNLRLLNKLSSSLFVSEDEIAAFNESLLTPKSETVAIIALKSEISDLPFDQLPSPRFFPHFAALLDRDKRPGSHELHQQGGYYCLDSSSIFAASALEVCKFSSFPTVFDLCSSPGGKAVFAWKLLSPTLLACNEVVDKRIPALISNLKRCGIVPAKVFSADPAHFAAATPHSADLVIVDAPCSGQSLIAKGESNPGCFHPRNIGQNSKRQKRILAAASDVVAGGGYLAYMTCTYSREENEEVIAWFLKRFSDFTVIKVPHLAEYQSALCDFPSYRLFPHQVAGAGAFVCMLQASGRIAEKGRNLEKLPAIWQAE